MPQNSFMVDVSSCQWWVMCGSHTRVGTRSALLTRLDGLASDELFAIPAIRTASVLDKELTGSQQQRRASMRTGLNHVANPTEHVCLDVGTTHRANRASVCHARHRSRGTEPV